MCKEEDLRIWAWLGVKETLREKLNLEPAFLPLRNGEGQAVAALGVIMLLMGEELLKHWAEHLGECGEASVSTFLPGSCVLPLSVLISGPISPSS